MKFLFFSILLCNITFFFWEYRKGAPEIYLPNSIENKLSNDHSSQIFLLSELPIKVIPLAIDSTNNRDVSVTEIHSEELFIGPKRKLTANGDFVGPLLPAENKKDGSADLLVAKQETVIVEQDTLLETNPKPAVSNTKAKVLSACYRLQDGEYSEQMFATTNKSESFNFELVQQKQHHISSYLVLTSAANSYQEAKAWEKSIKQQGINELWLFTQGKFKWRISLGLFSAQSRAERARSSFTQRISRELEVIPSYQTNVQTEVKISGLEKDIFLFKDEFSPYFKQESKCAIVEGKRH